ncbi:MAG: mandelate racemase/muconate lactonizing enzyme family protein, partial [Lachnospiraceae bacterium]|nr:mandelate racemase/muconate lactonizing enzyme family protein [Lachnospiraceae bacterium]
MKILTVEAYILNTGKPAFRPVVTRILTDEGIVGYGEASLGFSSGPEGALGMIREIAPLVIGMDPMANEAVWNRMYYDSFWGQGGGAAVMSAISAIDIAVWDIRGKALGVSVGTLLGGKIRNRLRCYASQIQFGWSDAGITDGKG